ncbi:EAL domain-containing protein [Colwellia sp. D2M02]|uniref:EAL domain-containing protein n=1 Tax=Colwellia asteriadis TaxID=517723 RepID=A0ABN1L5A0_9GAMM|nr:bifunctional diguanylate cyclase/phosphodiesterase [Colwellia sp. D2M02]MBU2894132.1 EAL domain-containing protein [Colwellia sp. D2M02]
MLTKLSFKAQVTWLSTSLILLTVVFLTVSNWLRFADYAEGQIDNQMYFAQNVLEQNLNQQEKMLITAANVLAADFGFKQAVATLDNKTIDSALLNHGKRINADLMMLLDVEGKLITSSSSYVFNAQMIERNINKLPFRDIHARLLSINNNVFQVIVVPVKAPRTIAYTVIGFKFDKEVLVQFKNLIALDVTLIDGDTIIESSIEDAVIKETLLNSANEQSVNLLSAKSNYFHKKIQLGNANKVQAILSASLLGIYEDFNQLVTAILIIALIVIFIAIVLSRLLSQGLASPLTILMNLTKKMSQGDFGVPKLAKRLPVEFTELYQGFSIMSSAIEHREQEIIYQADHDLLTGLYNRHKIVSKIEAHLSNNVPLLLVTFNIKGFKALNDTIGVTNADGILKEISVRITKYLTALNIGQLNEAVAARTNSDEFLLVMPIESMGEVNGLIELLQIELNLPFWVDDIKISLSLYFGVANSIEHGVDSQRLIRRSTMAAVSAYQEQLSLRFYQEGEDEAYLYNLRLIEELKSALESEVSPLFMNYQPKLNLVTGKVDKLEALIRWINKEGDFVNPELFVDLAEKSGLIVTLTRWVILHVIQQVAHWNHAEHYFKVSINLSAQDIQHEEFIEYLLTTVRDYQVKPQQITLELTERDLAENEKLVASRLEHLKSLGFEVSVDDYGIGQSSLAKLKNLPVDELKIDKVFILALDQCKKDQDIVSSTISLGHKLGLRVVAEGVENKESLALLAKFNCDYVQGYYLSRPVTAEKFIQWYESYEPSI